MKWFLAWLRRDASSEERAPHEASASDVRHELGRRGELHVEEHYRSQGYAILARRWRCAHGEVDLIVERRVPGERRLVIAVEVKTRRARRRDGLDDPVAETRAKQLARVERALRSHPCSKARGARRLEPFGPLLRVDLASVIARGDEQLELRVWRGRPFEAGARSRASSTRAEGRPWKRR